MKYTIFLSYLFLTTILTSCDSADTLNVIDKKTPAVVTSPATKNKHIVAKINNELISRQLLDKTISLNLYDLEWRKYELRRAALQTLIKQRISLNTTRDVVTNIPSVEILLQPPTAPRITLPSSQHLIKGNSSAPVTLSLFCSYQSSHCARLQTVIDALELRYKTAINIAFYDLPQHFHRYGKSAANAVYCAEEFGTPSRFQSAIYNNIAQLNFERYNIIAEQLKIPLPKFKACLKSKKYYTRIEKDITFAGSIGLGNVPVLFINGLYVKGPQTTDGFTYYIDEELQRISRSSPILSYLPLALLATQVADTSNKSTAKIKDLRNEKNGIFNTNSFITPKIQLLNIDTTKIIIRHNNINQFILLTKTKKVINVPLISKKEEHKNKGKNKDRSFNKTELMPMGTMTLSKDWITKQLVNEAELASHFKNTEHVVEGVHLLKLHKIDKSDFYQVLGLQTGDVVLQVNNQWIHEQQNSLWQSLQSESQITLLVMRGGFPIRYDYTVE
jgi:protein-disulfide isomerase